MRQLATPMLAKHLKRMIFDNSTSSTFVVEVLAAFEFPEALRIDIVVEKLGVFSP